MKGYLKTFRIDGQKGYDPKQFTTIIKPEVINLIKQQRKPTKVRFILTCRFFKENKETGHTDESFGYFHSFIETITESTDFYDLLNLVTNRQLELVERFQKRGSGWIFDQVEYLDINIDPFEPLSGSSYIPLPKILADKKAIINVKNEGDHECFKWAVTSAVFPKKKDPQRRDKLVVESKNFDWTGIEFPVTLKQIDKFEKQNKYAIKVYGYENQVFPLRISNKIIDYEKDKDCMINLLLISNDETNHYCWIKNIERLVSTQIDKHHHSRVLCYRCLNSIRGKSLSKHLEACTTNEVVKIEMPMDKDGNPTFLKFKNFNRKVRVPFFIYADFESFTEKIQTCNPSDSESFTNQYQKHKPSGFCYLIKCFDDDLFPPKIIRLYKFYKADCC